ncbi:MAG TPA: complex I NDUFA9 subunit family protein, partial [Gammaproteobacteria bacterium]|nr:complex I NDUFA9 subunit family protein [Gammaproteobacteria bacterium]
GQPYSYDNYLSASRDNIGPCDGLEQLGITPTAVEAVVPSYLSSFSARRRYDLFRKGARRV